jgi:hypothetical protein
VPAHPNPLVMTRPALNHPVRLIYRMGGFWQPQRGTLSRSGLQWMLQEFCKDRVFRHTLRVVRDEHRGLSRAEAKPEETEASLRQDTSRLLTGQSSLRVGVSRVAGGGR